MPLASFFSPGHIVRGRQIARQRRAGEKESQERLTFKKCRDAVRFFAASRETLQSGGGTRHRRWSNHFAQRRCSRYDCALALVLEAVARGAKYPLTRCSTGDTFSCFSTNHLRKGFPRRRGFVFPNMTATWKAQVSTPEMQSRVPPCNLAMTSDRATSRANRTPDQPVRGSSPSRKLEEACT